MSFTPASGVPYTAPASADPDDDLTEAIRARNLAAIQASTNLTAEEKERFSRAVLTDPVTGLIDPDVLPAQEGGELTTDLVNKINQVPGKADQTALDAEVARAEAAEDAAQTAAQASSLQKTSNLSDLASATTARTNLGLGTASTQPATAFETAGAAAEARANASALVAEEISDRTDADGLRILKTAIGAAGVGGVAGYDDTQTKLATRVLKGEIFLNLKDYGAVGNGIVNDTAAVTAWLSACASSGTTGIVPSGTYKINSGITWDAVKHSIEGVGDARFDFTTMTSGYAITLLGVGARSSGFNSRSTTHEIVGLQIVGPDNDATTVDCFFVDDTANNSQVNYRNLYVFGFRDQWYFDRNNWCHRWFGCTLGHVHRRIVSCASGLNAGENYSMFGCTLYSSTNAAHDATALYTDAAGNIDFYFFGCSFDYNDIEIDHNGGIVNLIGCHFEDRGNNGNPMIKLSYTPGLEYTNLYMSGGVLASTETTDVRDSLIQCVSGNAINVTLDGVKTAGYGRRYDIVKVLSGSPTMSYSGGLLGTSTQPSVARPGLLMNLVTNAGFEAGDTSGWGKGGTVTYVAQQTNLVSDSFSTSAWALRIRGTGTAGASFIGQTFNCPPNTEIITTSDMFSDVFVAGVVDYRIRFLAADASTLSTTVPVTVSAVTAWTHFGGRYVSPPGTAFVQIQFVPNNLNGDVYVDNVYLAILRAGVSGALLAFGTGANTITQGNDSRVVNAAQIAGQVVNAAVTLSDSLPSTVFNSSGAISQSLPAASAVKAFRVFQFNSKGTGVVTITGTISGVTNRTISQWQSLSFYSDGTDWHIV